MKKLIREAGCVGAVGGLGEVIGYTSETGCLSLLKMAGPLAKNGNPDTKHMRCCTVVFVEFMPDFTTSDCADHVRIPSYADVERERETSVALADILRTAKTGTCM